MSEIVLVHGIGADQSGPEMQRQHWLASLSDGIRHGGSPGLAERIVDPRERELVRAAHYGDLFATTTAPDHKQGTNAHTVPSAVDERFAIEVLRTVADRAPDARDREEAHRFLEALEHEGTAQGAGAVLRSPLHALARLRWPALKTIAIAERILPALRHLSVYFTDPSVRHAAQERVRALIDGSTRVVVAHSLGSVVAYEALHQSGPAVHLITLGSPLGTPNVVFDRLLVQPPRIPRAVVQWVNFADPDDIVALAMSLAPVFLPSENLNVGVRDSVIDNGRSPHDVRHYLVKKQVGEAIAAAFDERTHRTMESSPTW